MVSNNNIINGINYLGVSQVPYTHNTIDIGTTSVRIKKIWTVDIDASGTITGALTGNASTATALQTARTIGGVSFNGSANINLPGVNTAGNQNTTGNAATATKLATARTIGGVSFDGSANINLPGVNTAGNQNTSGQAGSVAQALTAGTGLSSAGTYNGATARTFSVSYGTVSGTACQGNDTRLSDSRVASDVYAWAKNASLQVIDVPTLNQSTTGNAATATKLATARTLWGNSFDGTANIGSFTLPITDGAIGQTLITNGSGTVTWQDVADESIVKYNAQVIDSDITIPSNKNGSTVGPITIASGVTVTVETGGNWVIL